MKSPLDIHFTHGSLFSGIGGFDLAAQWMGWENAFHCEKSEHLRRLLKYYWPQSKSYEDIRSADFTFWRGQINILSGGFPCQPYSHAGQRQGDEDDRNFWPEMLRSIHQIQPDWVLAENVYGLTNWKDGSFFIKVLDDLDLAGYYVQSVILPACTFNAPHKRERIWILGCRKKHWDQLPGNSGINPESTPFRNIQGFHFRGPFSTHPPSGGRPQDHWSGKSRFTFQKGKDYHWEDWPTQSPICSRNDGIPHQLDGITISTWKSRCRSAFGNAVVPQIPLQIFKTIQEMEKRLRSK